MTLPAKKEQNQTRCQRSPGRLFGAYRDLTNKKLVGVDFNIRCNSWACPICNPIKNQKLRARAFNGKIFTQQAEKGQRKKYNQKFLTLTCPGAEYRANKTPEQALDEMQKNLNRLFTALKKYYGRFMYLRVTEKQKDGFPHFHVLLVGPAIAKKNILDHISDLWRDKYKMGFMRINVINNDLTHGIRYLLKYLTKNPESIKKKSRIFSASRDALAPELKTEKDWIKMKIEFGYFNEKDQLIQVDLTSNVPIEIRKFLSTRLKIDHLNDEQILMQKLNKNREVKKCK